MKLADFVRPESLSKARSALQELGNRGFPLAGGTALHFLPDAEPQTAVDLFPLGLSGIEPEAEGYRIGAMTSLAEVMHYRADPWALHEVTRRIATHQVRNISTVGGNIVRVFPWADLPVSLLVMEAVMRIRKETDVDVRADEFFAGQPYRLFEHGDLLTSVWIPHLQKDMGFGYHKEVRTMSGFGLLTAAAILEIKEGNLEKVRIAVGSGVPFPRRLPQLEQALTGCKTTDPGLKDMVQSQLDDVPWRAMEGLSAEYIKTLAVTVIGDVIDRAITFAEKRT